jgi:hypothetical protein
LVLKADSSSVCSVLSFLQEFKTMKFGQYLHDNKYAEWADQYLDYDALKKIIKSLEQVRADNRHIIYHSPTTNTTTNTTIIHY